MKNLLKTLLCLLSLQITVAAETGPEELVRQTTQQLLSEIKSNTALYQKDSAKLHSLVGEVVLPHFDLNRMIDLALGRHKSEVSAEQRPRIINEFQTLLVRTYSRALLDYNNQEIVYLPTLISSETGDVTVRTEIEQAGGFPIPLTYSLSQDDRAWKVYDISVDEISLVTNYRSSFARQIKKHGVDGLIETLQIRNQASQN